MAHHKVNPLETLSKNAESYTGCVVPYSFCQEVGGFVEENGGIAWRDSPQLTPVADYGQLTRVSRRRRRGSPFTPAEFWRHVTIGAPDACWLWQGTVLARNGYGAFWYPPEQETMSAHRVAWLLIHGPIGAGLEVMHVVCDTPRCCNVFAHCRLGTHKENMADMIAKGRRSPLAGRQRKPKPETLFSSAARVDPARVGAAHSRAGDQSVPARLISDQVGVGR